jgi:dTMP kinase
MLATPGLLITFEGSEGCGKSTQITLLKERLESQGRTVTLLREPGGTELGERIRELLQHSKEGEGMAPEAELLLFAASRAQLVRQLLRPKLEAGQTVILDRFYDSTTVYQGMARGLPMEAVRVINDLAVGVTVPQLTLVLDMDAQTARSRIVQSGRPLDRIESQPLAFFEKVRAGYLKLAVENPLRMAVVDAAQTREALAEQIWNLVQQRSHAI